MPLSPSAPHPRQPHQHPTTQFFTGRMPFLPPNQQRQRLKTEICYIFHLDVGCFHISAKHFLNAWCLYLKMELTGLSALGWWLLCLVLIKRTVQMNLKHWGVIRLLLLASWQVHCCYWQVERKVDSLLSFFLLASWLLKPYGHNTLCLDISHLYCTCLKTIEKWYSFVFMAIVVCLPSAEGTV